jgi:hypothetical protein
MAKSDLNKREGSLEAGVTLVELVVTTLLASILLLAVGVLVVNNLQRSQQTVERIELEANFLRMEIALRTTFANAIDVRRLADPGGTEPPVLNAAVSTSPANPLRPRGWVRDFAVGAPIAPRPGPTIEPLAAFPRETNREAVSNSDLTSYFASTALFYVPPTYSGSGGEFRSGVLMLALGSGQTEDTSGVPILLSALERTVRPGYNTIFLDNVTDVSLRVASSVVADPVLGNDMVQFVDLSVTVRAFLNPESGRCYAPTSRAAGPSPPNPCAALGSFSSFADETRTFRLTLNNNDLGLSPYEPPGRYNRERAFGRIYFFPLVAPSLQQVAGF